MVSFQCGENNLKKFVLLLVLVCFLFSGCATLRQEGYVKGHPEINDKLKEAILGSKIYKGMTKEEVIASWGEPEKKGKVLGGFESTPFFSLSLKPFILAEEEWVYSVGDYQRDRFGDYTGINVKRRVFFRKGKVVNIWKQACVEPLW